MSAISSRMDTLAHAILARPRLVKAVQTSSIVSLGIVTGIAGCMYVWIIPIVRQGGSSRTKTTQFRTIFTLGGLYLQPFSKIVATTLASMAYICSRSQNPIVASRWMFHAAAAGTMALASPYEIITIFPTNDRVVVLDDEIRQSDKDNFKDQRDQEVDSLLTSWRKWHTGRVVLPLIATSILAWGALDLLPL